MCISSYTPDWLILENKLKSEVKTSYELFYIQAKIDTPA